MAAHDTAHQPNAQGVIHYQPEEHGTWQRLITRQQAALSGKGCDEYQAGLARLALPTDHIPQLAEINRVLQGCTGWSVAAVPALISFDRFFALLANRQFPVATFIRRRDQLDYLQEPDIFHEVFGHCAMLTNPEFAHFTHLYGQLGLRASKEERVLLARLYWFTVEFGLINTADGLKIYGGGILSSIGETAYALSGAPQLQPFDLLEVLRTPYRIDIMQPIYFVLPNFTSLYQLSEAQIMAALAQAQRLGLHPPRFAPAPDQQAS
ncbi:phenylalanine 4-monooxygenase [Aeromonas cavernicola]|uniref:Phenylalanine-4-hydroxylase n=1 Tax=Aeromonas cavernicola TaxID=1006623 RepID=A0A2H9U8A7_9GAMM|nr:phenylalanine 4-monooxygenase [Aeromonas cavernicola]PJG60244.1 phenylalanine 4-monooxygenase [Aeromonas cavernicola]